MKKITNIFKQRLKKGDTQYGVWNGLVDTIVAEILAGSGFDWILVDGEHGPFDLRTIQTQLQAIEQYNIPAVVRPPVGEQVLIKQLVDIGVQSLLIPNVETAEHAEHCAKSMRYAPEGVRGVGSALARAAKWNRVNNYYQSANDEMCLVIQVESVRGVENLDEILEVENVDAVFLGPSDLAASMGYLGNPGHPDVVKVVKECIQKITNSKKEAGILTTSKPLINDYINQGVKMVGIGIDTLLLAKAAQMLAEEFKPELKDIQSNTTY